jgi:hypothetical protein
MATTNTLSGLEIRLNEAIEQIRQNLSSLARVKGVQGQLSLRRRSDGQIMQTLPDYIRVWVLESRTWDQVFGLGRERGRYKPTTNKILLKKENWCRDCMVHESLHSVSMFSHPDNSNAFDMMRLFVEGATEFLTGLLLWRAHRNCYENWRLVRFPKYCGASYPKETKTFLAFCGCANAQSLLDLYFGAHSDNLGVAWSSFIEAIRNDTGKKFKDVFPDAQRIGLFMAFKNECDRQFGRNFRKLQKSLDYSSVF